MSDEHKRTASEVDVGIEDFLDSMLAFYKRLSGSNQRPRIRWEPEGDVVTVTWSRNLYAELYRDMRNRVVAYIPVPGSRRQFPSPKKAADALFSLGEGGLRVGASNMTDLHKSLVRLAHQNPELRPHILPLLKEARGVALKNPECMLALIDAGSNRSKFYEMEIVPQGREPRAKKTKDRRSDLSRSGYVLVRRWGRLTDSGQTGRVDSMNDIFDNQRVAWVGYRDIYNSKTRKGYEDFINKGEYPVGLGGAGFGWGGQAICRVIPEVRAFRSELDRIDGYLKGLRDRLRPIAKQDSTMARNLENFIGQLSQAIDDAERYIDGQLQSCEG